MKSNIRLWNDANNFNFLAKDFFRKKKNSMRQKQKNKNKTKKSTKDYFQIESTLKVSSLLAFDSIEISLKVRKGMQIWYRVPFHKTSISVLQIPLSHLLPFRATESHKQIDRFTTGFFSDSTKKKS